MPDANPPAPDGTSVMGHAAAPTTEAQSEPSASGHARRHGDPAGNARWLSFSHTHTGEQLSLIYAYGAHLVPEALASLTWLLRDFRNGATHAIDPALFDQLHTLHRATASRAPFEIISGYRSPETNAMLHRQSDGVASRSLHLVGQAIDVRLGDVPLADLRDAALSLRAGGVGFYAGSNFVHLDTGRVRHW